MLHRFPGATTARLSGLLQDAWRGSAARQWLQGLSTRDRNAVHVLAVFLAALVIYTGIWQPVSEWQARADERYRSAVAMRDWMERHAAELQAAADSRTRGAGEDGSLLSLVANSAASQGVELARVQPEGVGVSVVIREQEFEPLITWLGRLLREEQLAIRQLSIDAQSEPGYVTARISLM